MAKEIKLSQESLDNYKEELEYLKTTRADEVAEQLKEARSFGDLSENAEYDEAKNEQGKLYSRIAELWLSPATPMRRTKYPRAAGSRWKIWSLATRKSTILSAPRKPTPWRG